MNTLQTGSANEEFCRYENSSTLCAPSLTLDHHLVTGNQYLLAVTGLCVLEDSGSGLSSSCRVGHGQSLEALDPVCTVVSQLDGPALCDCNCGVW